jgi:THO complex subunit 4
VKTVGPVRECFIVYNSSGRSKGIGIVEFHRPGDAVIARQKYNGKTVDGRKFYFLSFFSLFFALYS